MRTGSSLLLRRRIFFTFRISRVVSSRTWGIVENSWCTPLIRMDVTAAPGKLESNTRRSELPRVMP